MTMRLFIAFASLLLATLLPSAMRADDDTTQFYDEIYNRPTYFPDFSPTHKYPNNMSYFVCTLDSTTGERLYNYEVAVYDADDTLRATGRSRLSDKNVCTLTIMGTEGETFHFKIIYGDFTNPTIVDAEETCQFITNDIVGGFAKPFWLTQSALSSVDTIAVDTSADNTTDNALYDLQGRRIYTPAAGQLYIKNGKKYITK